jgi:Flp pilus assembly protein CpaB
MKPTTMILMVAAVACGLGASYMIGKLLADRNKSTQDQPTIPVLVAKERVPGWQPIKDVEKVFEIKYYPQDVAPPKPVSSFEELKDQQLNKFLDPGKPLTQADLLTKEQREVALQIQPGQRALAIKVNTEALVGGYVLPGSRVDFAVTIRGANASTRIFLQNMLVLAVDQTHTRAEGSQTILGQTVTVAASPEESTRLSLAASLGELRLYLRRPGDVTPTQQLVTTLADLSRPLRKAREQGSETERTSTTPTETGAALPDNLPKVEDKKEDPPKKEEGVAEENPKSEKEEVKPETKPETKPAPVPAPRVVKKKKDKDHIMTLNLGAATLKKRFSRDQRDDDDDDDADDQKPGKASDSDKDEKEVRKPADATPPPPPASPFGRSSRTRGVRGNR